VPFKTAAETEIVAENELISSWKSAAEQATIDETT
jgi:hypothetical protein